MYILITCGRGAEEASSQVLQDGQSGPLGKVSRNCLQLLTSGQLKVGHLVCCKHTTEQLGLKIGYNFVDDHTRDQILEMLRLRATSIAKKYYVTIEITG